MKRYCAHCGRVAHRCDCAKQDSALRQFLARSAPAQEYVAIWREAPYKRGVPPQIKRRERNTLKRNYAAWFAACVAAHGEQCLNCGDADGKLVLDHVLPIAKGGLSTQGNMQLLCAVCNRIKGKLWIDCRTLP